jgi:hypothetical protein
MERESLVIFDLEKISRKKSNSNQLQNEMLILNIYYKNKNH